MERQMGSCGACDKDGREGWAGRMGGKNGYETCMRTCMRTCLSLGCVGIIYELYGALEATRGLAEIVDRTRPRSPAARAQYATEHLPTEAPRGRVVWSQCDDLIR